MQISIDLDSSVPVIIVAIDWSTPDSSTDVVDIVHLSNGRKLSLWNGKVCYNVYDESEGPCEVGAELIGERTEESYSGEPYSVFKFA